jgi:hypothetical protein
MQPATWGKSRYVTMVLVVMLHAVLIEALLSVLQSGHRSTQQSNSVELLFLPPVHRATIHIPDMSIRPLGAATALSVLPQYNASSVLMPSAGSSSQNDGGSGVNWTAEARRALRAFEIRSHLSSGADSVSDSPEDYKTLPGTRSHVGERFKLANGDWIVWIDANCYQVASADGSARGAGEKVPVCDDKSRHAAQ